MQSDVLVRRTTEYNWMQVWRLVDGREQGNEGVVRISRTTSNEFYLVQSNLRDQWLVSDGGRGRLIVLHFAIDCALL